MTTVIGERDKFRGKLLHYKDIGLIPRLSYLNSRADANTSVNFCGHQFNLPVIPANMESVIDFKLAEELADRGYFYILHRFYDYELIYDWVCQNQFRLVSISVGVQDQDYELIKRLQGLKVDFVCVDIAHGFSRSAQSMIDYIKRSLPQTKVIAGNIFGDFASIKYLEEAGADALKIGLSFGAGCTTFSKTSFCSPLFSCGLEAFSISKLPLIGDGSITCNGDIAKGLRAGFTMLMAGSIFAACKDGPATFLEGKKLYYGSASAKAKGHNNNVEGREILLSCNGLTILEKMDEIKQDLQSAISYSGGADLSSLKHVDWFTL